MSRGRCGRKEGVTVDGLCKWVGFSRQAFYKGKRSRRRLDVNRGAILEQVKVHRRIHPRMGGRKLLWLIGKDLEEMGIGMGRDRFFSLLREEGLLIKRRRGGVRTTDSGHGFRVYSNRMKDAVLSGPNQGWVGDLTYIRTEEGFLYLSLLTDSWSRKIVGFEASDSLEAEGCLRTLRKALSGLSEGEKPIHHSDRGTQYCCGEYVTLLRSRELTISMTEENHCYENAQAERVNGILKTEYGLGRTFGTKEQGKAAAKQAVEIYNNLRPHLALNYRTPSSVHENPEAVA